MTFIELIKNSRYGFWRRNYAHISPELGRVFESVARSCVGQPGIVGSLPPPYAQQMSAAVTVTAPVPNDVKTSGPNR